MVTRAALQAQSELQKQIFVRGEIAFQCDVCSRRIRVPSNRLGLDIIQRCIITKNCLGKLHRIFTTGEANNVAAVPPAVPNVIDWSQRRVFFLHEQPVENTTWTIEHNLANKPSVQTFVTVLDNDEETLVEIVPQSVRAIDLNTVEVKFATPQKGLAHCLATASVNTINPNTTTTVQPDIGTLLLTNKGELTIATLNTAPLLNITVTYKSPNVPEDVIDVEYIGIDDAPSIKSPWVGVNTIFVAGRTYVVRSFNIVDHPLAPDAFINNLIANGTQFFIASLSTLPNQNLILLGRPPFTSIDKILDQYVDIGTINQIQPELVYAGGEAFVSSSAIRTTYPPIFIVD